MKLISNKTRAVVFAMSASAVTLLGLVGASWSNLALADGTVAGPSAAATATATLTPQTVGAPCDSPNLILNDVLANEIAAAVVSPTPSHLNICTLLQVVPEPNATFPTTFPEFQIPATGLFGVGSTSIANPPTGYSRISDAVQFAGVIGGNKVRMSFVLPASGKFKAYRVAYFDTTPAIHRWVFITTKVTGNIAAMTKGLLKPIPPVVFALFGQN